MQTIHLSLLVLGSMFKKRNKVYKINPDAFQLLKPKNVNKQSIGQFVDLNIQNKFSFKLKSNNI